MTGLSMSASTATAILLSALVAAGANSTMAAPPGTSSPTVRNGTPMRPAGGAFRAAYWGTALKSGCGFGTSCTITFNGVSNATILFQSTESGITSYGCQLICGGSGYATLVSAANHNDSLTLQLYINDGSSSWQWYVSSGTGKYQKASGSGVWTMTITGHIWRYYHYQDQWSGTLRW